MPSPACRHGTLAADGRRLNLNVMNLRHLVPMYPAYSRSERIADGAIHLAALVLALTGSVLLIVFAAIWTSGGTTAAVAVYGGLLTFSFIASGCYHFTPWERFRPTLQRIDHAAIYLKIAGTYTPLVVLIGSAFGYAVLATVWLLAVAGAIAKLFFWRTPGRLGPLLYLGLGWASVLLVLPLAPVLPLPAMILIGAGGLLYSAGVLIFVRDGMRFVMPLWHGVVLAASACFFAAISLGVFDTPA
jgi:hemolysin III